MFYCALPATYTQEIREQAYAAVYQHIYDSYLSAQMPPNPKSPPCHPCPLCHPERSEGSSPHLTPILHHEISYSLSSRTQRAEAPSNK